MIRNSFRYLWMFGSKIKVEKKEIRRESQLSTWQAPIIVDVLAKGILGAKERKKRRGHYPNPTFKIKWYFPQKIQKFKSSNVFAENGCGVLFKKGVRRPLFSPFC